MIRPLLPLVLCLLGACASPDPVDFTTYSLGEVSLDEASEVVRDVTQRFSDERFGGRQVLWDPESRNLSLEPVFDETRRMTFYAHVAEAEEATGSDVEMLALVENLLVGELAVEWGEPKKDVYLEQVLHQAYVDEILDRRRAAGGP